MKIIFLQSNVKICIILLLILNYNNFISTKFLKSSLKQTLKSTPKADTLQNHFGTSSKLGLYGPNSSIGENFDRLGLAPDSKHMRSINPTMQIPEIKSGSFGNLSSDAREFINPATAAEKLDVTTEVSKPATFKTPVQLGITTESRIINSVNSITGEVQPLHIIKTKPIVADFQSVRLRL